ncbi:hypothetical protein Tco_0246335 [Tanacetum coccineum]
MAHDLMDQVVRAKVAKDANNKRNGKMIVEEIQTNNKTRGMRWLEYTLLDQVTRKNMLEPYHSATSVNFIITTVPAQLHVRTARRSVTNKALLDLYLNDML